MIIDISKWQGVIDWSRARAAGVEAAIIKATGAEVGHCFTDSKFSVNWAGAYEAGIVRGCYHFLHGGLDGVEQAQYFLEAVAVAGGFQPGDILPVCDVEWPKEGGQHCDIENVRSFKERVGRCIIYTGGWYWNPIEGDKSFARECPLWLAAYTQNVPRPPAPWETIALWQYSDKGRVDGIQGNVDVNRLVTGTLAELTL